MNQGVVIVISQRTSPALQLQPSADDSAALINQSIVPTKADPKDAKTSRLKRISEVHPRNYLGTKGNQRRLLAAPRHDLYDVDKSLERVVKPTRQRKAPSVDPEELQWPARIAVPIQKKRKLAPLAAQDVVPQGKGYETRPKAVRDGSPNISQADLEAVADNHQFPTSSEIGTAQKNRPSGGKRGRPSKARLRSGLQDTENTLVPEEAPQIDSSVQPGKRRPGRPRKAPVVDSQQLVEAIESNPMTRKARQEVAIDSTEPTSPEAAAEHENAEQEAEGLSLFVEEKVPNKSSPRSKRTPSAALQRKVPRKEQLSLRKVDSTTKKSAQNRQAHRSTDAYQDGINDNNSSDSSDDDFKLPQFPKHGKNLLRTAFAAAVEVERMRRDDEDFPAIRTDEAKRLLQSCRETKVLLVICEANRLATDQQREDSGNELKIKKAIKDLCQQTADVMGQPDWDNKKTVRDLYAHVFPKLTLLLRRLLRFYVSESTPLSYEQLRTARKLTKTITQAGYKVQRGTAKKLITTKGVKGPLKTTLPNLRQVLEEFEEQIESFEAEHGAVRREERAGLARIKEEQDEERQKQEAKERAWVLHWDRLHSDRLAAELRGKRFLGPQKTRHLRVIPLEKSHQRDNEVDANGEPIERMQMFGQRGSQAPDPRLAADFQPFAVEPLYTLLKGLEMYAGTTVYQRIFEEFCRDEQPLQPYSVSEIVEQAVWLRRCLIEDHTAQGTEVRQWVHDIPDPRVPPC